MTRGPDEKSDHQDRPEWPIHLGVGIWSFAEATLFFIVPDVLLSLVALDRPRSAFRACLTAVLAALAGALLMYAWGGLDPEGAREATAALPAIDADMQERVAAELRESGALAVLRGPVTGTPFKLYAIELGAQSRSLPLFLLVGAIARAGRFLLLTAVGAAAGRWILPEGRHRYLIAASAWAIFYAWFFIA